MKATTRSTTAMTREKEEESLKENGDLCCSAIGTVRLNRNVFKDVEAVPNHCLFFVCMWMGESRLVYT